MNASIPRLLGSLILAAAALPVLADTDLSIVVMTRPLGGCALGSDETVALQIFNHGDALAAGTRFSVAYGVNGTEPVSETVTLASTLLADSGLAYSFSTPADLSVPGRYVFDASVRLAGDINPTNDRLDGHTIVNSAVTAGGKLRGPKRAASGILSLMGHTGQILGWSRSEDNGGHWQSIDETGTSHAFDAIWRTTQFRVEVKSGSCVSTYSNVLAVDPP